MHANEDQLRDSLQKLAAARPEMRKHLLPLLRKDSAQSRGKLTATKKAVTAFKYEHPDFGEFNLFFSAGTPAQWVLQAVKPDPSLGIPAHRIIDGVAFLGPANNKGFEKLLLSLAEKKLFSLT